MGLFIGKNTLVAMFKVNREWRKALVDPVMVRAVLLEVFYRHFILFHIV